MFKFHVIERDRTVTRSTLALVLLTVSLTLIGCERSGDDDPAPDAALTESADALASTNDPAIGTLAPDNNPAEILGDWTAGCVENVDSNGVLVQHLFLTYSIDQNTWRETIGYFAVDDPSCNNPLGTVVYSYQIEILNSATAATLNGNFFGNATNIDVIDTDEDLFGDAAADDLGSAVGIWLVKDNRLYSHLFFGGSRPDNLLDSYAFTRS